MKMAQCDDDYDSVVTAAYAYINEYRDWEKNHKNIWEAANIKSSEDNPFSDTLVGTMQTCDGCGAYTKIVEEDRFQNGYCRTCCS